MTARQSIHWSRNVHISTKYDINPEGKDGNNGILKLLGKTGRTIWTDQIATYKPGTVLNISCSQFSNRMFNEPISLFPNTIICWALCVYMCEHLYVCVNTHVHTHEWTNTNQIRNTSIIPNDGVWQKRQKNKHKSYTNKKSLIHPFSLIHSFIFINI